MTYAAPILDRLQDCFEPISLQQLAELESAFDLRFLDDYRGFLLSYNSPSCPHPLDFPVRCPSRFVVDGTLSSFLGIVSDERFEGHNILWNADCYNRHIPPGLLPIAHSGIEPICLGTALDNFGKIYLWDIGEEDPDANVHLVADSFSQFLECLYPVPEEVTEELPIFQAVERGELETVRDFLIDGGKVDCRNAKGQTLLMCAARTSWPKIVRLLLEHGAAPNTADADDCSPLYHAAMQVSNDSVKLLLAAGADARWCDERGCTLAKLTWERCFSRVTYTLEEHLSRADR